MFCMYPKKYRSTALPTELYERVEMHVGKSSGYVSVLDFLKDAVRRRLDEIENETKEVKQ